MERARFEKNTMVECAHYTGKAYYKVVESALRQYESMHTLRDSIVLSKSTITRKLWWKGIASHVAGVCSMRIAKYAKICGFNEV